MTSRLSFLILEAAHRLRIPVNVGVCVGRDVDPRLLRRGVEILVEDRIGVPKFLGVDHTVAGFARNGFRRDGAPSALALAVAAVQPGFGNTAPLQIDLDLSFGDPAQDVLVVESLIRGHFDQGGTQVNINVLDQRQLLEAHRDPSRFPDLIVRVTGFSAYFASLSPELRQLVVDRMVGHSSPLPQGEGQGVKAACGE